MIEPGSTRRGHLPGKLDVRSVRQYQRRPLVIGATEPAHLDDAASRRGVREGFGISKPDMMSAAIRAVDHRLDFYPVRCRWLPDWLATPIPF